MLQIGGVKQSVWFRGRDTAAPALQCRIGRLFSGCILGATRGREVVSWKHRSRIDDIEPIEQDLDELVDLVRNRFGKERVILLGHSWGTILGTRYAHVHPEKVAVYVGVAQIADFAEGEQISLQWALAQVKAHDNQRALNTLQSIAPAPQTVSQELELGRWVGRSGVHSAEDSI